MPLPRPSCPPASAPLPCRSCREAAAAPGPAAVRQLSKAWTPAAPPRARAAAAAGRAAPPGRPCPAEQAAGAAGLSADWAGGCAAACSAAQGPAACLAALLCAACCPTLHASCLCCPAACVAAACAGQDAAVAVRRHCPGCRAAAGAWQLLTFGSLVAALAAAAVLLAGRWAALRHDRPAVGPLGWKPLPPPPLPQLLLHPLLPGSAVRSGLHQQDGERQFDLSLLTV